MQTSEERARLFKLGQDGSIFCVDLSHADGQQAAEGLAHIFPDVAAALRTRSSNLQYLLVLIPASEKDIGVLLSDTAGLPDAVAAVSRRTKEFGPTFAVVISPRSSKVADLFAPFIETAGTA